MDIVERLRKSGHWEWEIENICGEAADEIERLREEVKDLKVTVQNLRAVAKFYKTNGMENG